MKVIANAPVPEVARRLFAHLGEIEVADRAEELAAAEVMLIRGARLDAATISQAGSLKVIARTGAGIDNVDLEAASARGVPVVYAPDQGVRPVAEGALALIFATAKRLGVLAEVVREGRWDERYDHPPLDLDGAVLGIVGLGRIGSEVGRLAAAVGMSVVATEPSQRDARNPTAKLVELEELLERADVISLHCDLNPSTEGLVDRDFLARAKRGLILINVARGRIIESDAVLKEALDNGQLSAVGLDVFSEEPPAAGTDLLDDPRVICTPHSIGLTAEWNSRVFSALADDVSAVLEGGLPTNVANREAVAAVREA